MNDLEQLKHVLCEVSELRAALERFWKCPSSSQLDTLPEKVHDYLHQREMTTDPIKNQAVLKSARETTEALTKLNVELRKSLNVQMG